MRTIEDLRWLQSKADAQPSKWLLLCDEIC